MCGGFHLPNGQAWERERRGLRETLKLEPGKGGHQMGGEYTEMLFAGPNKVRIGNDHNAKEKTRRRGRGR